MDIVERALVHVMVGGLLYLAAAFAFHWAQRRRPFFFANWWPRILPAFAALAVISFLEAFDVAAGQSRVKTLVDLASWTAGLGLAVWALYRWERRS